MEAERKSGCILKCSGLHPIPLFRGGGKPENPEKNHRHALNYQESHTRRKICAGARNRTHNPQVPLALETDALPHSGYINIPTTTTTTTTTNSPYSPTFHGLDNVKHLKLVD
jgi:hypothetical protein